MEYKYGTETLEWCKKLFPMEYQVLSDIENNSPRACDSEIFDVEPIINVTDVLTALEKGEWGINKLRHDCQRRYDILSLLARMEDEMGINLIEIE